jgi:hypothetical protein
VSPLLAGCQVGAPGSAGTAATGAAAPEGSAGPTAEQTEAPDLTAELVQYRRDAQRDVVQVKVTNHGDRPVLVERVTVTTTTFVAPVTAAKDSMVGAGLSVDLTVPLGQPACGPLDATAAAEPARPTGDHVVDLGVDGRTVSLPVGDALLQELLARRCALAAVGEVVTLAWRPVWTDGGVVRGERALVGTLVATPVRGGEPFEVSVEGATTLFTVTEPVAARAQDGAPVELQVRTTVTRCDPHAVAEDKKGYLFPVTVQRDGQDPVLVEVAVPVPERVALQDLIGRTC